MRLLALLSVVCLCSLVYGYERSFPSYNWLDLGQTVVLELPIDQTTPVTGAVVKLESSHPDTEFKICGDILCDSTHTSLPSAAATFPLTNMPLHQPSVIIVATAPPVPPNDVIYKTQSKVLVLATLTISRPTLGTSMFTPHGLGTEAVDTTDVDYLVVHAPDTLQVVLDTLGCPVSQYIVTNVISYPHIPDWAVIDTSAVTSVHFTVSSVANVANPDDIVTWDATNGNKRFYEIRAGTTTNLNLHRASDGPYLLQTSQCKSTDVWVVTSKGQAIVPAAIPSSGEAALIMSGSATVQTSCPLVLESAPCLVCSSHTSRCVSNGASNGVQCQCKRRYGGRFCTDRTMSMFMTVLRETLILGTNTVALFPATVFILARSPFEAVVCAASGLASTIYHAADEGLVTVPLGASAVLDVSVAVMTLAVGLGRVALPRGSRHLFHALCLPAVLFSVADNPFNALAFMIPIILTFGLLLALVIVRVYRIFKRGISVAVSGIFFAALALVTVCLAFGTLLLQTTANYMVTHSLFHVLAYSAGGWAAVFGVVTGSLPVWIRWGKARRAGIVDDTPADP